MKNEDLEFTEQMLKRHYAIEHATYEYCQTLRKRNIHGMSWCWLKYGSMQSKHSGNMDIQYVIHILL